jgi:negative regulator of flagellin synthesis FlgM
VNIKINDSTIKKAAGLSVGSSPARSGKAAEKGDVEKASSDNVTLSPKAQALASQGSGNGVFDLNKVNEIKDAIASGRFQINAERIADGLIDSVKNMISARKE